MNSKTTLATLTLLGFVLVPLALADDTATITVVGADEVPEQVVNRIELPDRAAVQARASASGLDTATRAREQGREAGQERAAEAREGGRQFGERIAEQARDGNVAEQIRETISDRRDADRPRPETPAPQRPDTPAPNGP